MKFAVFVFAVFYLGGNYFTLIEAQKKNVCSNLFSYAIIQISSKCFYNPDVNAEMPELVSQYGYNVKAYEVETDDGYILTVFNIVRENPKGVVFLQHPATATCSLFVDKRNVSLGISLWNEGYDIWLGNFRGSYYSRKHKTLNPDRDYDQYWNFTFHEMGIYDLPAQIDLVINQTKAEQVTYIAHSMGGIAAAIYSSARSDHSQQFVRKFILMAPAIFMEHSNPVNKPLAPLVVLYYNLIKDTPLTEIIPRHGILHKLAQAFCTHQPIGILFCQIVLMYVMGGHKLKLIDWEQAPIMVGQSFGGMSVKTFSHYAQLLNNDGQLTYYDYGKKLNQQYYNSDRPPQYPLEKINNSMHIMAGVNDKVASYKDCLNFFKIISNSTQQKQTFQTLQYGHVDFVYSNNLPERINRPILKVLSAYSNN